MVEESTTSEPLATPGRRSDQAASSDGTVLIRSCDALRPVDELLALAAGKHNPPLTPQERRQ